MITTTLSAIIGNYLTSCFVLGLIVAAVQIIRLRRPRTAGTVSGIFLNTYLLYGIGVGQIVNFIMHSFFGDYAAKTIGWAQSPFQLELAFCSLGIGVAAILVHGKRADLIGKFAVVLAVSIFGYGAAGGHIYQLIVNHDFAANNGGLLLAMDIVTATLGIVFVIWHAVARHRAELPAAEESPRAGSPIAADRVTVGR
jgi:hypothetical protein